ncbi:MAG: FAD-binding domain-containing protein [Ekhidna sp.]
MNFPTEYAEILKRIDSVDPEKYGKTRNYLSGAVTYLSPYISRGVISTKMVYDSLMDRGYVPLRIGKMVQELAWRDYWQQVWIAKEDAINEDLKHPQPEVENHAIPEAIIKAETGIEAIDKGIKDFCETGYLHNHLRMYIASIACNIGKSHWKVPAKWMYYHLLDADWASNALSWQWVAGSNANKKYVANQENINEYCYTDQKGTFLDIPYEDIPELAVPDVLADISNFELTTALPEKKKITIEKGRPTLIYNSYNLDPLWHEKEEVNRILLLEPSHFSDYPISQKSLDFILKLSQNIANIQLYIGEFDELTQEYDLEKVIYKEHPLSNHYKGEQEPRDWIFNVKGYFGSFFAYWKKCKKELK